MTLPVLLWAEDKNPAPLRAILESVLDTRTAEFQTITEPYASRLRAGNGWRSARGQDASTVLTFCRRLADHVKGGGVVLFHYDGDTPWSAAEEADSRRQFEKRIRTKVLQLLPGQTDAVRDALIEIVPHYSIEAWLYQATDRAAVLCDAKHGGRHRTFWQTIAADRPALDERIKPKDNDCIRDQHNDTLSKDFPCGRTLGVGKSFLATVKHMLASPRVAPHVLPWIAKAV